MIDFQIKEHQFWTEIDLIRHVMIQGGQSGPGTPSKLHSRWPPSNTEVDTYFSYRHALPVALKANLA